MRLGSSGTLVRSFQEFLIERGYLQDAADGMFGVMTEAAVRLFQAHAELVVDGWAGARTQEEAKLRGWIPSDAISALVREVAAELDLDPDILEAFRLTESGSGGPGALRFEPHVFLRAVPEADIPYTPSDRGAWSLVRSETGLEAFQRAFAIDRAEAVKSTSWGLYQVLGGHLLKIWPDPEEAVLRFQADSERVSHSLLVSWMRPNPRALRAAREMDWEELALRYNGPGQQMRYAGILLENWQRARSRSDDSEGDRPWTA